MPTAVVNHDVAISGALKRGCEELCVVTTEGEDETRSKLADAEIFASSSDGWRQSYLDVLSPGDWIQITGAGYDQYPIDTFRERGIKFTNGYGLHDAVVSEHVFALAFSFTRRIHKFVSTEPLWDRRPELSLELSDWKDQTLTVFGLGNIGESIAERGSAFEMNVYGIKRNPDDYKGHLDTEHVLADDEFTDILPETDLLVASVPLTESTRGAIDSEVFDRLPESAILINVSRGAVVDESALLEALRSNKIAGAGLDVFEQEPLPDDSPFWSRDDVIVTPHVAARSDTFPERFASLFFENYERWRADDPLLNQIL